jgi:hypothetical protein
MESMLGKSSHVPTETQECKAFLNCVGQMYILTPHLTPEGIACELPEQDRKRGKQFIIDVFDERNTPQCQCYFGHCANCHASLMLNRSDIEANC